MHEIGDTTVISCSLLAKHLILWISDPLATPTECVIWNIPNSVG